MRRAHRFARGALAVVACGLLSAVPRPAPGAAPSAIPAPAVAPAEPDSGAVAPAVADSGSVAPADSSAAPVDTLPGRLVSEAQLLDRDALGPSLVEPSGIAVDAFGRFVVSDAGANRVLRYDRDGKWLTQEGALGSDPNQLRRPTAVTTLGSLGVAVLDRENRRVISYDLLGRRIGILVDLAATDLLDRTGRVDAIALTSDRGGALYVADAARDRILVFDFSGQYLREIGGYGTRSGAFRGLSGLATTPRGEVVACERAGHRLQVLDAGGRVVRSWPLDVDPGRATLAVAVDDSVRIAVGDGRTGVVRVFDRSGRTWAVSRGFQDPRALAFAPDGSLLVVEAQAGRVTRFRLAATGVPPAPAGD